MLVIIQDDYIGAGPPTRLEGQLVTEAHQPVFVREIQC